MADIDLYVRTILTTDFVLTGGVSLANLPIDWQLLFLNLPSRPIRYLLSKNWLRAYEVDIYLRICPNSK